MKNNRKNVDWVYCHCRWLIHLASVDWVSTVWRHHTGLRNTQLLRQALPPWVEEEWVAGKGKKKTCKQLGKSEAIREPRNQLWSSSAAIEIPTHWMQSCCWRNAKCWESSEGKLSQPEVRCCVKVPAVEVAFKLYLEDHLPGTLGISSPLCPFNHYFFLPPSQPRAAYFRDWSHTFMRLFFIFILLERQVRNHSFAVHSYKHTG